MKRILLILLFYLLCNISFSQGWMPVKPNPYNDSYMDFSFPNAQTGYGVAPAFAVIKTTNSGATWTLIANLGFDVQSIYFVNAETGFVAGDYGMIYKTTNGGYNWTEWMSPYSVAYINDIQFTDSNTGYACTRDIIYKTTDQGIIWDTLRTGLNRWMYKISFVNNDLGYVTGDYGMYKTTDGGESWNYVNSIETYYGFVFKNEMTGYVGSGNNIRKTTDGGTNWDTTLSDDTLDVYNIFTKGPDTLYAGTNKGIILKTTNGGLTWEYQDLQLKNSDKKIAGIYFINANTGFCSGGFNDPFFYYTTTGGTVGISNLSSEFPEEFILHQNFPNPFNPETKIRFEIPYAIKKVNTKLVINNSIGQEVRVLVNESLNPGIYEYTFEGRDLPSGVYFYTLSFDGFRETKRMVFVK